MSEKNITFEDLPKAMSWMMDKLNELDSKIDGLNTQSPSIPTEQWMNLKELCDYIPSHPAEQTVYGWTSCHQIPFHKRGKRIMFLKSEIDAWLRDGKVKSEKDLEDEAARYNNMVEDNKGKKENCTPLPEKPILRRTIISDFTPEALMRALDDNQRGIVVYVDEIMGMFNAVNQYSKGQLIEQLLTAFSGKPLDISRCSMPIPIHIEHPFINMVGTMQTTRMHELTDKGYKDNGLIDRIIFVYPSSQEISDWQDEENAFTTFDKYSSMWENIINKVMSLPFIVNEDGEIVPDILDFSSEAKAYFTNWRNDAIHAVNQIQDDGLVDSRIMKAPMITARLALVMQIFRWACGEVHKDFVDIDSIKSAIALSDYFESCYADIQKYMLVEGIEPQKKELLDCLSATFTTADAIQAGKEVGLSERSVMYSLVSLTTNKIIKKIKRGEYEKLQ